MKDPQDVTYVVVNDETQSEEWRNILRTPSKELAFPLSDEDKEDIATLSAKFDSEENIAGLAAPQIGIAKRFFIFTVPDDPIFKKWRPDIHDTHPKTLLINASYEPIGDEKTIDYEACFSVEDLAAQVARYTKIKYTAYNENGEKIDGIAEGYSARVLQHEMDHINGKVFTDIAEPGSIMKMSEYREMRAKKMAEEKKEQEAEATTA